MPGRIARYISPNPSPIQQMIPPTINALTSVRNIGDLGAFFLTYCWYVLRSIIVSPFERTKRDFLLFLRKMLSFCGKIVLYQMIQYLSALFLLCFGRFFAILRIATNGVVADSFRVFRLLEIHFFVVNVFHKKSVHTPL